MSFNLTFPKDATFPNRSRGDSFEDSITKFVKHATTLLHKEVGDAEVESYLDELSETLTEAVSYLYWTRKYRDHKLAEGYEKYPKPQYNNEAQVALARKHASAEVRLHELLKDLRGAIYFRKDVVERRRLPA